MAEAKLIVGLGNPGPEYAGTRHNVGYEVIDRLAAEAGADFGRAAKTNFHGLILPLHTDAGKLLLLKPTTYMNRSGQSVQAAAHFYKLGPADLIAVLDEIQLPAGQLKLARRGSHGGHNGLRDLQQKLGTQDYPRLRIGVDRPPPGYDQADYVLGKFTPEQREATDRAVRDAAAALTTWQADGIDAAMNKHHGKSAS